MRTIKDINSIQEISEYFRTVGKKIGFVPTMGSLHEGHVSLILRARDECDILIVSIFVNPTQFLPDEDFNQYPRDFLRDYHICKSSGVDYIFFPDATDIYPEDYSTYVNVEGISEKLEGKFRPGHFIGVTTIVLKLFNLTKPHFSYFGQKDAQQALIIKKMIKDLNIDTEIKICETYREKNGLAMSSRNEYLSRDEKIEAGILYKMLCKGKKLILEEKIKDADSVKKILFEMMKENSKNIKLQYLEITDSENLNEIKDLFVYRGGILISLAGFIGKTRLIDNVLFYKDL